MTRAHPEDDLQMAVAEYLDLRGWLWNHTANERKTTIRSGRRLKRKGVKPGVPDVMIYEPVPEHRDGAYLFGPFVGVALELKSIKGRPTKEQREWLAALKARGWKVAVCRTIDDVIEVTKCIG